MSDKTDVWSVKKVRRSLLNADINAIENSGLLDQETLRDLYSYERAYKPGTGTHYKTGEPALKAQNTQQWRDMVRPVLSQNIRKAVNNGNTRVLEFAAAGLEEEDDYVLPFAQLLKLENLLHGDRFRIFLTGGGQGGGKSYLVYVLARYKANLCKRDGKEYHILTNSVSAVNQNEDVKKVESPKELMEYRRTHAGEIVFVLDEASSFMSSKAGAQGVEMAKFTPFLRRLRKLKIMPMIVTHRWKDIGPDIRSLDSAVYIDNPDKDTAVFYDNLDNDTTEDEILRMSGYSTDELYEYDTEDIYITWSWDGLEDLTELMSDSDEFRDYYESQSVVRDLQDVQHEIDNLDELEDRRSELIRDVSELGYSQREIADMLGISRSNVRSVIGG